MNETANQNNLDVTDVNSHYKQLSTEATKVSNHFSRLAINSVFCLFNYSEKFP